MAAVSYSIGRVLEADELDFTALYYSRSDQKQSATAFVEECFAKKNSAGDDAKELSFYGMTHSTVVQKLLSMIERGKLIYDTNFNQQVASSQSTMPVRSVAFADGEGQNPDLFKLSGFNIYDDKSVACCFCDHRIVRPRTYLITNVRTNESISVNELTLHFLQQHGYLGDNEQKLSVKKVCSVIIPSLI